MELDKTNNKNKDSIGKFTGFFLFRNLINEYNTAKEYSESERYKIKKYGVISLILSLISLIISASCLISKLMGVEFFGFSYVLMLFLFILVGFIICLILSTYSFIFGVMQVRLNRRSIGIFGIVFSTLGFVSSVLLIIFLFI